MDSRKVLYFLELLNNETSGHADELAELFSRALDENEDVVRLKSLLTDYVYYREGGDTLKEKGSEIIEAVYSAPAKALETLPHLKHMLERIEKEVEICDELMRSPFPFNDIISVLKKKDTMAYLSVLKTIAGASVYLMMLYGGMEPTRALTWADTGGIQEMVHAVNAELLPALCRVKRPEYSWVIRRKRLGGKALLGGDGYVLSYESARSVETVCRNLNKEPIGTHAFLNVSAYESGTYDVPFCWGTGNIISITPDNALLSLQKDVATKLRAPQGAELYRKLPTPFECVKQLADGRIFCISPENLLLAMNQWEMGYEIEKRKQTHNCLICGKHIAGNRLACSSHFITG